MKKRISVIAAVILALGAFFIMFTKPGEIARYALVTMASSSQEEKEDIKKLEDELEQQIQKAQENIEAQYSNEQAEGQAGAIDQSGGSAIKNEEGNQAQAGGVIAQKPQSNAANETGAGESQAAVKPSKESIEQKYRSIIGALRSASYAHINSLIGQAKGEYMSYPEDEREDAKYKVGLKYFKMAKSAEKTCDGKFYSIVDQLQSELQSNGYSTEIVEEAKAQYKAEKKQKRDEYFAKMGS